MIACSEVLEETSWDGAVGSESGRNDVKGVFCLGIGGLQHSRALKLIGKSKQTNPDLSDFLLIVGVLVWGILWYFGVI